MSSTFPVIGPRFAVPMTSNVAQDYFEMRRVGSYPENLLLACVVCYVETQLDRLEQFTLSGLWRGSQDRNVTDQFEKEIKGRQWQEEGVNDRGLQDLLTRVSLWMEASGDWVTATSGQAISSLSKLEQVLPVTIRVYASTQPFPSINLGSVLYPDTSLPPKIKLTLCICEDVIFLLYPYISPSNFIRLSCGHHIFSHLIFSQMSQQIGVFTVSESDLMGIQVTCMTCSQPSRVQPIRQGYQFVFKGTKTGPDSGCCEHQVSPLERLLCKCGKSYCNECVIMRSLSVFGPFCLKCNISYIDELDSQFAVANYLWLRPYLNVIKRMRLSRASSEHIMHLQAPSPELQSSNSFSAASHHTCERCSCDFDKSICPKKDCCASCLIEEVRMSFGRFECPECGTSVMSFYNEERKCSSCKRPFKRLEMFLLCYECKLQICSSCVKKTPQTYNRCKITEEIHKVNEDKVNRVLTKSCRYFR